MIYNDLQVSYFPKHDKNYRSNMKYKAGFLNEAGLDTENNMEKKHKPRMTVKLPNKNSSNK